MRVLLAVLHFVGVGFHLVGVGSGLVNIGGNLFLRLLSVFSRFFLFFAVIGSCGKWNGGGGASDVALSLVASKLKSAESIDRSGIWSLINLVQSSILTSFETPAAIPTLLHHDVGKFLS